MWLGMFEINQFLKTHKRCSARSDSTHTHTPTVSILLAPGWKCHLLHLRKQLLRSLLRLTQVWALHIYVAWREDIPGFGFYHWNALPYGEILHPLFRECAICSYSVPVRDVGWVA